MPPTIPSPRAGVRCATMCYMERVGVRELRQNASVYLRRVSAGETIEVTDRGHPVARLVPVREEGLDRLIREGRAGTAAGDLLASEPVPGKKGHPTPGEILAEARRHER